MESKRNQLQARKTYCTASFSTAHVHVTGDNCEQAGLELERQKAACHSALGQRCALRYADTTVCPPCHRHKQYATTSTGLATGPPKLTSVLPPRWSVRTRSQRHLWARAGRRGVEGKGITPG